MYVAGRSPCPRHDGHCAYLGTEPDRCADCHTTWSAIDSHADETRDSHVAAHRAIDRRRAKEKVRKALVAQRQAAQSPHSSTTPTGACLGNGNCTC